MQRKDNVSPDKATQEPQATAKPVFFQMSLEKRYAAVGGEDKWHEKNRQAEEKFKNCQPCSGYSSEEEEVTETKILPSRRS